MDIPSIPINHIMERAISFAREKKQYNQNDSFPELETRKGRDNYYAILDRIEKEKGNIQIATTSFQSLGWQEFKDYLLSIYVDLLGKEYKETIENRIKKIRMNTKAHEFDAYIEEKNEKDNTYTLAKIHVNPSLYSVQVSNVAKVCMIDITRKFNTHKLNDVIGNTHYTMILPNLIEAIFAKELETYFPNDPIVTTMDKVYINFLRSQYGEMKTIESLPSVIRKDPDYKLLFEYEQHYFATQFLGIVYTTRLLEYYEQNPKELLSYIHDILAEKRCVNGLLQDYQVSLRERSTVQAYMKKLEFLNEEK